VTQKYYETRAINSDKAIGYNILLGICNHKRVQCQKVLCGSEVTRKIKQLEVERGARAPVPHSWRRQWQNHAHPCSVQNICKQDTHVIT